MREWRFEDIGGGFCELSFVIEGDKEEAQWRKTFPDGTPGAATASAANSPRIDVVMTWRWEDAPTPGGQMVRRIFLRPELRQVFVGSVGAAVAPGADVGKIADVSTRIAELVKKSDAELETLAGELGVKFKKKDNPSQKAAAIVSRQDELAAAGGAAEAE